MRIFRHPGTYFAAVLVLLIGYSLYDNWFSYESKKQRLLSEFADSKETHAMLLSGYASQEGDTVFFDILPRVSFALDRYSEDIITVKTKTGEKCQFKRGMMNMHGYPDPLGDGKAMESWKSGSSLEGEEKSFAVFERVVKKGICVYDGFGTEEGLIENFMRTYHKSRGEAEKLAREVRKPLFEKLDDEGGKYRNLIVG
jgi:hypothetical protein